MDHFDPLALPFWYTVGASVLCGAIVGTERQLRGKPAGVRTSILVCLGTAIFLHLGASIASPNADPTRVLGQLVTGIGFLGAGVMFAHQGVVTGVTTAAVIWLLAAIGAAIGLGRFQGALALALVAVFVLSGVGMLESSIKAFRTGAHRRNQQE